MKTFTVHFIRHAATKANENGRYIGSTDLPLSEKGKEELKNLQSQYIYPNAEVIYSSPLKRCTATAKLIYPNRDILVIDGLREYDFGIWEGKTANQLENDENFKKWIVNSSSVTPQDGENTADFSRRVIQTFDRLFEGMMRASIGSATIITHSGVIMTLLTHFGLPKADFYDWLMNSGCGFSVRTDMGMWMRDKKFEVYSKVPYGNLDDNEEMLNLYRKAADTAYGKEEK